MIFRQTNVVVEIRASYARSSSIPRTTRTLANDPLGWFGTVLVPSDAVYRDGGCGSATGVECNADRSVTNLPEDAFVGRGEIGSGARGRRGIDDAIEPSASPVGVERQS